VGLAQPVSMDLNLHSYWCGQSASGKAASHFSFCFSFFFFLGKSRRLQIKLNWIL
jgi:hypothetical protein